MTYTPPTADRPGFCLGCGKDVGPIKVTPPSYGAPIPDCAHPSWCYSNACLKAKRTFRELTDKIIYSDHRRR